jgi:hypothetical protein
MSKWPLTSGDIADFPQMRLRSSGSLDRSLRTGSARYERSLIDNVIAVNS